MDFPDIRYCKECGKGFDIGTNKDLCPECRGLINKEVNGDAKDE